MNIKYVINSMDDWLNENYPLLPAEKIDLSRVTTVFDISRGSIKEIAHLKHMIVEMREMPIHDDEDVEKLMRWIGFVQGALWSVGYVSIDNFREMNTHE